MDAIHTLEKYTRRNLRQKNDFGTQLTVSRYCVHISVLILCIIVKLLTAGRLPGRGHS